MTAAADCILFFRLHYDYRLYSMLCCGTPNYEFFGPLRALEAAQDISNMLARDRMATTMRKNAGSLPSPDDLTVSIRNISHSA
jgi:hypothetical protein